MQDNHKLNVVLYWHMHQPDYRVSYQNDYSQPWTYLHTIKDYVDMAMHLESIPDAHAVFNFTPILLDQIEDYSKQITNYLDNKSIIRDPLLYALAEPENSLNSNNQIELVDWCIRAHEERIIQRYPAYNRLVEISNLIHNNHYAQVYLSHQFIIDLLVWYHLGWIAEMVKKTDIRVKRLIKKEHSYDENDRIELLTVIKELISSVIPRYRTLAESGQIEVTTSPYAHPIIPLLIDFDCASEAVPDLKKPKNSHYPGGKKRADWHIQKGIETFIRHFGFKPTGCWPSEGGISFLTCQLLENHGFKWTASGNNVFKNSVLASNNHNDEYNAHQANKLDNQDIACFFRDDELSDLIGFEYSSWHADDAVANLIHRLLDIASHNSINSDSIVAIVLDGENAWEHYPENGYYFLKALYQNLSSHPQIKLTTFSEYLDGHRKFQSLSKIVAGSWVYGTFTTWIGSEDKNLAWDMLCDAKSIYDKKIASDLLSQEEIINATLQLAKCESSDWFWWFGDYNPEISVSSFEKLFRENLTHLYKLLKETPPHYLSVSFTKGTTKSTDEGTMRRGSKSL